MTAQASASQTARQRARAELTREIKHEARRQLASHGAEGLSLRAVARELGMVSSALYRYFPSRDDLLTALIIDAYDALGDAAEAASAAAAAADGRGRWRALCAAIRGWALAHPHEYALIYGSPVPGYQAPQATIASAVRVVRALGGVLAGAGTGVGAGDALPRPAPPLPEVLAGQTAIVADAIAPGTPGPVIARGLIAWTQLFGLISFELFGQLVGTLDPADEFFGYAVEQMAGFIGLP
ncbi:MAG TPA: TetR/AcrR family transcriptional regulator [Streptosporangiaceae bacterium]|nr:TetR/AcrR family transcriptional regulator [Streptosporangiaceae bacterium]